MRATKILSNRFLLLFLLLISLSSCDWDAVIFYYDGTPQGPVATDNYNIITSVSYIYEGRDGTDYGPISSKPTNIGKYKVSASGTYYDGINTVSFDPETDPSNSTNFEILPANSRISASITIDQAWVDANSSGPWTISASSVTVTFGENFTISNTNQYFIISGSNVTINGAGKIATISGVTNYPGLVVASASNASSAIIKNIGIVTEANSTLISYGGWISQTSNKANIINCYSTGNITNESSGGIAGPNNSGNISNCHSSGNINGLRSGGIAGYNNSGNIFKCYSTGPISGIQAGGIAGENNQGNISNCYTSGNISGAGAGGIAAYSNLGTISNCYTSGNISGQYTGGIAGYDGTGAILNCYTSGSISGRESGGIAGNYYKGAISNCRSSGTLTTGRSAGIILGVPSTGNISNSINVTPATPNTWDNTIADIALTGLGTIWDQSNTPYTLFPPPLINITLVTAPLTSCSGSSSTPTTFGVTGSGLTASVTITAPSYFEISTSSGGTYSSSLTLTNTPTVSQTLYVRLNSFATAGDKTGTVTATSTGASDVTTTVSGTVKALPILSVSSISLCAEATYLITKTTSIPVDNGWSVSGIITVNNGYVIAGTTPGNYTVSYTDGCAQTVSATVNVATTSSLPAITDAQASYKFNNNPQGPIGSGNVNYMGYNGFTYSSTTRPINPGFYRANNVSGSNAGCPTQFYIFRCTTCPD